uniref:Pre-rRNA-processing protein TSR2 homolog n=1 Tax=Ciona savignyi TaxID=51511 RepID=H2ZE01_CIOSA
MTSNNQDHSLFYQSIQAILKSWTGLQLAIAHGFGGVHSREKAQWLVGVIETFFKENDDIESWELEDFIDEIMATEFNTLCEDEGSKVISQEICKLYRYWIEGKHNHMKERLIKLQCVNLGECVAGDIKHNDQIPDEEANKILESMTICSPNGTAPELPINEKAVSSETVLPECTQDDGWTTVNSRTRRKRNK